MKLIEADLKTVLSLVIPNERNFSMAKWLHLTRRNQKFEIITLKFHSLILLVLELLLSRLFPVLFLCWLRSLVPPLPSDDGKS